ncbi:MAG: transposase [Lachnospiraceae bacterium]|nr:transposase [Lachnospiraceae bacterium]
MCNIPHFLLILYLIRSSCYNYVISQHFYNVTSFSSVEVMDELTIKYINWYNYIRPHSYNNYLTPMEARYR